MAGNLYAIGLCCVKCILIDMYELLEVEDSYVIRSRGVVLIPDFAIPQNGWKAREEVVQVELLDGTSYEAKASIDWAHFSLADPNATPDERNRVVLRLVEEVAKIAKGTRILASKELCEALLWNEN